MKFNEMDFIKPEDEKEFLGQNYQNKGKRKVSVDENLKEVAIFSSGDQSDIFGHALASNPPDFLQEHILKKTREGLSSAFKKGRKEVVDFLMPVLSIESFLDRYKSLRTVKNINKFLHEDNPEDGERDTVNFLISSIKSKKMKLTLSDDELKELARIHVEKYNEILLKYMDKLQEVLPGVKRSIIDHLRSSLGEDVDFSVIEKKLDSTEVSICDPLSVEVDEEWGHYRGNSRKIFLSYEVLLDKDILVTVLTHELLHAVSGNLVIKSELVDYSDDETSDDESYNKTFSDVEVMRVGLAGPFFSGRRVFAWLNEAVTESINIEINNHEEKLKTYKEERTLFDLLCMKGSKPIDKRVVYGVYFEDYDLKSLEEKGTGVPKWKEFWQEINEAYCSGFLRKLDSYIKQFGIKEAVLSMQSDEGIEKIKNHKSGKVVS